MSSKPILTWRGQSLYEVQSHQNTTMTARPLLKIAHTTNSSPLTSILKLVPAPIYTVKLMFGIPYWCSQSCVWLRFRVMMEMKCQAGTRRITYSWYIAAASGTHLLDTGPVPSWPGHSITLKRCHYISNKYIRRYNVESMCLIHRWNFRNSSNVLELFPIPQGVLNGL